MHILFTVCLLVHMTGKGLKTTKRADAPEVTGTSQGQCEAIGTLHNLPHEIPTLEV